MKKAFIFIMSLLGICSNKACTQQNYETTDVENFSKVIDDEGTVLLDVRTASEYSEGHLEGALNIDVRKSGFIQKAAEVLPLDKTIAVYCRSGRRSANASGMLADKGYKVVNLDGGIIEWQRQGKPVTTDTIEVDRFTTKSGKTVKFYALVHASIRIVYDNKEIQVDPVKKLGNRQTDYASMPKADYILITHEHGDHFDKDAISTLTKEGTVLVANKRCADMLGYGQVMSNGDTATMPDFTIEAVPAYNITEGRQQFHPKGRDNGYILTIDGLRIYIAGDTEDIPEMQNVKDIDIAFFPCNQPYTMTTDQLVRAATVVKPKVLFPYHYSSTDVTSLPEALKSKGVDVRIRHYE